MSRMAGVATRECGALKWFIYDGVYRELHMAPEEDCKLIYVLIDTRLCF